VLKTEVIVEIAQAHDGSLGILHSYIDAIAESGADTVKFQMHIADAESSVHEPFRINFSYEDKTRFDYWKRMGFSFDQWVGIKQHCDEVGINFLCSPFSIEAFNWLEKLGIERYKIASGEVNNNLLLDKIALTKKPVLLSSGMSSYSEIDSLVELFRTTGNDISIFQCTTAYPTPPEQVGLNVISEMIDRYDFPIGLSDHSGDIYASLAAVSLGARLVEVHAVFDKRQFGPDSSSSLTIESLTEMVRGIRKIDAMKSNKVAKDDEEKFEKLKQMFGKTLSVRRDIEPGEILQLEDLESKKPANMGIPANEYKQILGRQLVSKLKRNDFLQFSDLK
jgi:N-acetylneuraminate synthase